MYKKKDDNNNKKKNNTMKGSEIPLLKYCVSPDNYTWSGDGKMAALHWL